MSFDDYAQHLAQKYRLAISLAILNKKPADLTIDEFLGQIRSTIEQNTENIDDDFNISACSDDFIDSSEVNDPDQIMNQKEPQDHNVHDKNHMKESHEHTEFNHMNRKLHEHTNFNDHDMNQNIHDFNFENNEHGDEIEGIVVSESQDIAGIQIKDKCENNEINSYVLNKDSDVANKRREKFREIIKVLKGNDVASDKVIRNDSQPTFQNSLQTFDLIDLTQCDDFSITETLHNSNKEFNQNAHNKSHGNKDLNHTNETNDNRKVTQNKLCDESKIPKHDCKFNSKKINSENVTITKNIEINKDFETNMGENIKLGNNSDINKASTNNNLRQIAPVIDIDTQETIYTQTNTQYSPSQMNEVIVNTQFIHGNKNTKYVDAYKSISKEANLNETQNCHNNPENTNEKYENTDLEKHKTNNINNIEKHTVALQDVYKDVNERNIENGTQQNMDLDAPPFYRNAFENCTSFDETTDRNYTCTSTNEKDSTVFDKTSSEIEETGGNEKIPFKIIEEMNRIKIYLRRNENNDLSSGYKSSQTQSSFGGTPQNVWIGQSANNIFDYLKNCLLLTSTHLLTEQISEMLGQLIDRLHSDESYPAFLEDLLTTIDGTLQMIYEEDNYSFHVGQKKDEQMQRVLLLNKSSHVQKFTIEKINDILQKSFDNLSNDDTIEIQNINEIENLCYIFQILQVLLPKYSVNQNDTHNSDTILRKKDITDIWRRKWLEQKIDKDEGSFDNKCVLKDCSDILNKIIVNFMDGYPLIAFSALNCFNLMQT